MAKKIKKIKVHRITDGELFGRMQERDQPLHYSIPVYISHLLSKLGHTIIIKIIPIHNFLKPRLTQVGIGKMLPLRRSDPAVHYASRLPAKEASHLPINKPNNPVIVNYAVGLGEVVVHETHVRVGVGV